MKAEEGNVSAVDVAAKEAARKRQSIPDDRSLH
jgi:hypothetical protein